MKVTKVSEIYIGTDIIEVQRISSLICKYNQRFTNRIFTKSEIEYCQSKQKPEVHYSGIYWRWGYRPPRKRSIPLRHSTCMISSAGLSSRPEPLNHKHIVKWPAGCLLQWGSKMVPTAVWQQRPTPCRQLLIRIFFGHQLGRQGVDV